MPDPDTTALFADDLGFQYPTQEDDRALEGVSFAVPSGSVLGVIGPVEAGKTSLSMLLAGFVPSVSGGTTTGEIRVAGRDPRSADDNRVAMLFEDYSAQLTQIRVIDEVMMPLLNRDVPFDQATDRARELLDTVRLDVPEDKFTWELSGGQQQRLAIAAALAIDPEVLIFDTATDMLDPKGQVEVSNLITSLAGDTTLVVAENDPEALVGVADRVLALEDGRPVTVGPADEVLRDAALLERIGVTPPLPVRVARAIGLDEAPLTPGEFVDLLDDRGRVAPSSAEAAAADSGTGYETPGDEIISVESVTYEYADGTIGLDDVDMTVHAGEVHAVVGGNGAGKSTLVRLLGGLSKPTEGRVIVDGTDTRDATARDLAESVGTALQNPDEQLSEQTVRNELRYPLERRRYERTGPLGLLGKRQRWDAATMDDRVERVLNRIGLPADAEERDPIFLPRGLRRLVTLGSALTLDPRAVVLDEPIAGLSREATETVRETIEGLRAEGRGVVLIDHDMDFVCEVADRVTLLDDGRVADQGPVADVFAPEKWEWLAERYIRPPRAAELAHQVGVDALQAADLVDAIAQRVEVAA